MQRRAFLTSIVAAPGLAMPLVTNSTQGIAQAPTLTGRYSPGRIPNEYNLFLSGERQALSRAPRVRQVTSDTVQIEGAQSSLRLGDVFDGWRLVAILPWHNGQPTAVFEKHVSHQGAIVYLTETDEIARIPKRIGQLSNTRPRPTNTPHGIRLERPAQYVSGPDVAGNYILNSDEDPCYENVAALGAEFIGWTLVANEEAGPERSLWLEADGKSRQFGGDPQSLWAPDLTGRLFDPRRLLPSEYLYEYVPGYSKRTLLGGYLPVADIGVWNPHYRLGYEVMVLLPPGAEAKPLGRVRAIEPATSAGTLVPEGDTNVPTGRAKTNETDRYWNGSAEDFFSALVGIWNYWRHFFEDRMRVDIPDPWLLDAARAGIVLSRCSYRGLEPTYQIGEGAYTKIPERSHALFPVAHYEFIWVHQLWNLTDAAEPYSQHYLSKYILPNGNFVYNTQDQVEAPLNAGVFLENSARAYDYSHDIEALKRRLPVLRQMIAFVLRRYEYSRRSFPASDPRYGLIWGSPEADNGDPADDAPESHPYYYQNASWIWRGLHEHGRCLQLAGRDARDQELLDEGQKIATIAAQMRADIERSLNRTLADRNPALKHAGITPFTAFDTTRKPTELSSYENHRYMMDWWTSDWGDPQLDLGHFRHRDIAGEQLMGMNIDGDYSRTSNFMEHGTLAGRIRQEDYRPFLLALYGNACYAMDSGSRYAPEDALLPGNYPLEGSPYAWSAVINSELQPAIGLRWLLCYEEHDRALVHLQKAAPKHWFAPGQVIAVENCPTRFGPITWKTTAAQGGWHVELSFPQRLFSADLLIHVHPPGGAHLRSTTLGTLHPAAVLVNSALISSKPLVSLDVT